MMKLLCVCEDVGMFVFVLDVFVSRDGDDFATFELLRG